MLNTSVDQGIFYDLDEAQTTTIMVVYKGLSLMNDITYLENNGFCQKYPKAK